MKMNWYFEHHLVSENCGSFGFFCIAGAGACVLLLFSHMQEIGVSIPKILMSKMQVRKVMENVILQISDTCTQLIFCICAM